MDPLAVDPANLAESSAEFTAIGNSAHDIGDGTMDAVRAQGDFAGSDPFGNAFRSTFNVSLAGITAALHGLGDGMDATGDKLMDSASLYKASDEFNADTVPGISDPNLPPLHPDQVKGSPRG
jgi:hypothetical protein